MCVILRNTLGSARLTSFFPFSQFDGQIKLRKQRSKNNTHLTRNHRADQKKTKPTDGSMGGFIDLYFRPDLKGFEQIGRIGKKMLKSAELVKLVKLADRPFIRLDSLFGANRSCADPPIHARILF